MYLQFLLKKGNRVNSADYGRNYLLFRWLFHRNGFGQVARLIHVAASADSDVVGQ
jgi:hypothetical protein